jgi:hypothetical protein
LAATLKASFPQLRLCLSFDSLYGCGRAFAVCQKYHWHFVVTFKEGRTPDLWQEFQALLKLRPEQKLATTLPDKTRRLYRWVEQLPQPREIAGRGRLKMEGGWSRGLNERKSGDG